MRNGAAVIAARSSPPRPSQPTPVARREERSQPRSIGRPQHAHDRVVVGLETRSEEHTSELQSHSDLVCRLLLEKKKKQKKNNTTAKLTKTDTQTNARVGP